jgi:hypothetical protein
MSMSLVIARKQDGTYAAPQSCASWNHDFQGMRPW